MPYRTIPDTDVSYFMLVVDERGTENAQDPDASNGYLSDDLLDAAVQATDVFIQIHGWHQGARQAFGQFDSWTNAFVARPTDQALMRACRPGFKSLHLGLHWPSLAWGEGPLVAGDSFAANPALPLEGWVNHFAQQLGDSPQVRVALRAVFEALRQNACMEVLSEDARTAYMALNTALELGEEGRPGEGSADRLAFDPDRTFNEQSDLSFAIGGWGDRLLSPLRQLSFWTMKKRAKTVGEHGLRPLLARLQGASPNLRIHLMGHSFGCIVASAAIAGSDGAAPLLRPIDSCVLVQGALSLWSYAASVNYQDGTRGYFENILSQHKVKGPLVATRSKHDYAVGRIYPWAAGVAGQDAFPSLPRYGAIGAFGICGTDNTENLSMKAADEPYAMLPGKVYNVDGSHFINKIDGISGAHSDIAGPEVAHLIWQAALPKEDPI